MQSPVPPPLLDIHYPFVRHAESPVPGVSQRADSNIHNRGRKNARRDMEQDEPTRWVRNVRFRVEYGIHNSQIFVL